MLWGLTFPSPTDWNFPPDVTFFIVVLLLVGLLCIAFAFAGLLRKKQSPEYSQGRRSVSSRTPLSVKIIAVLLGFVFLLMAGIIWGVAGALQGISNVTRETPVACVIAKQKLGKTPMLSVRVILLDQNNKPTSDLSYTLDGDLWQLDGLFVKLPTWMTLLGFHSGYKVARLSGQFIDPNLQDQAHPNAAHNINGGYGDFFKFIITGNSPWRIIADTKYGTGVFITTGTYVVKASNTGFVPYNVDKCP
jgi:hypothetical protein